MRESAVFFLRLLDVAAVFVATVTFTALAVTTLIVFVPLKVHADEIYQIHRNPREEAMGGAYISVVNDEESLWFNPAGIARADGDYWTIANPSGGISNPDDLENLQNLENQSDFTSTLNSLYGKPMWADMGADTAFIMPGLAMGYYYNTDASILIDNPVNPTMNLNYIEDQGYALGTGFSLGDLVQTGFVAKYINRTGVRETYGADTIANIVSGTSKPSAIFDSLNNEGSGISLDWGTNLVLPGPFNPVFSFVWKDIGNTSFRPSSTSLAAPPTDDADMEIGGSVRIDSEFMSILPAFEVDELNDSNVQLGAKLHAGIELDLPLIALRAGLDQGYFSYGCGFNLGPLRIDAASWGEEIGGAPGQMEVQKYLLQLTWRLGFGSSENRNSNSSDSNSFFNTDDYGGDPDLKVRR